MKLISTIVGASLLTLLAGPAFAQAEVTLRISAPVPTGSSVCSEQFPDWAKRIEADSGGRIKTEITCDGILSKVGDTFDRIEAGIVDVGWDIFGRYGARFASLNAAAVPGLFTDEQLPAASAAFWTAYEEGLIAGEFENFKILWFNATGNGKYFLASAPDSNIDLSGRKIALGNPTRAALTTDLGGVPVSLSVNDYYQSLQKGVVDGAMTSVAAIVSRAIHEVTHYYIDGPFGGGVQLVVMNKEKYDALPDDLKAVIDKNSGREQSRLIGQMQFADEARQTAIIIEPAENQMVALTAEEVAKIQPYFDKLLQAYAEKVEGGGDVIARLRELIAQEAGK